MRAPALAFGGRRARLGPRGLRRRLGAGVDPAPLPVHQADALLLNDPQTDLALDVLLDSAHLEISLLIGRTDTAAVGDGAADAAHTHRPQVPNPKRRPRHAGEATRDNQPR